MPTQSRITNFKTSSGADLCTLFAHRCDALAYSGGLWTWGFGSNAPVLAQGVIGAGSGGKTSYTDYPKPTRLKGRDPWGFKEIDTGYCHALGLKNDGSLWSWGGGTNGALGLGNTNNTSSPTQIGTLTTWCQAAGGLNFSLALKTDGTMWSWGCATSNGQNSPSAFSSPVQVGTLTTWKNVAAGGGNGFAVKTDGTLWAWGNNNAVGQLGLNDLVSRCSPVQVGTLTNWNQISTSGGHTLAVKTDGTLWAWGCNGSTSSTTGGAGALGLGDVTSRSSPTQVGTGTNWSCAFTSTAAPLFSMATKTDGTLWAWGMNFGGRLGLGNTTASCSPVQVGALTDWCKVALGRFHTLGLKTDGTLWSWGCEGFAIGLGVCRTLQAGGRCSPVMINNSSDWSNIATVPYGSFAIKKSCV